MATILIGLGGTGIDCLRTIKTQVYARLRPDDTDVVTPGYEHIRFLGVDTDERSRGLIRNSENIRLDSNIALDDAEFFSIGNPNVIKAWGTPWLENRPELSWLKREQIPISNLSKAGAGGVRQIGRFMMMDQSDSFISRLEQEINVAKSGLDELPVHIHVFSGLSGGTGAGIFLDVCYMIQSIADKIVEGVNTYGYFFLPDVNLSKIPDSDNMTRAYVQVNGYAAMQELDYCMQLRFNGGSFVQEYKGNQKIESY